MAGIERSEPPEPNYWEFAALNPSHSLWTTHWHSQWHAATG